MTWKTLKTLTETVMSGNSTKLTLVWISSVRSVMHAASLASGQLPGGELTDVDDAPVILFGYFYLLIRESFQIQKWSLFSQFCVFW